MDTELKIYIGLLIVVMVYYFWYTRNSYWKKYDRKKSTRGYDSPYDPVRSKKTRHSSSYDSDCDCDE